MKIKTKEMSYGEVMALPRPKQFRPHKPGILFNTLVKIVGAKDLKDAQFTYEITEAAKEALKGPCLILMNHSSFIDLEIVNKMLYPKPYFIVCTSDGFVGKEWLMKQLGCIPTQKFVTDIGLIKTIAYALKKKKTSVLMYPEASYTFDGCATPLPRGLGRFIKLMDVPVIMIRTYGAFARDPLYNCLQKRSVKVSAAADCIINAESVKSLDHRDIEAELDRHFSFDSFDWQYKNGIEINEPFRADGLERILFKCACCKKEGSMVGKGTELSCSSCGKKYTLTTLGKLEAHDGKTEFDHIPDWYAWERECVKNELIEGTYSLETDVDIGVMIDYKFIYKIGKGHLTHDSSGFVLTGCDGALEYRQKPQACYGLYSDYYWYEIGDMICIGNKECLYYCFPEKDGVVAKTRMAAEELYKLTRAEVRK